MIYMDNAATTQLDPQVLEAMLPYLKNRYANPTSIYRGANAANAAVEDSREIIAKAIGCHPLEIYFTSGGSESANWALKGMVDREDGKKRHLITTAVEHHAVLNTAKSLERRGHRLTVLPVDSSGMVDPQEVIEALSPDTALVSVMYANNEIGTLQPIGEIGEALNQRSIPFFTDAVQAVGHLKIDVKAEGIDLLGASAHKFHGPKGVGFLYIKKGTSIEAMIQGGAQERGRRGGTLNVPGIVGMGKAMALAMDNLEKDGEKIRGLRDRMIRGILKGTEDVTLNGDPIHRLDNNINLQFGGIKSESLLILLDQLDIAASAGSACTSGSMNPSHVLLAIGRSEKEALSSLRLTLSKETTSEEVERVVAVLIEQVAILRSRLPAYRN